ncbi:hypothetical protein APA386B_1P120 (plasmid) [Acetobacter pasteurianus 386B]|nr:hypothetical protein APA386B_1P120 [Acetobacter pasteurianus 386B]
MFVFVQIVVLFVVESVSNIYALVVGRILIVHPVA